MHKNKIITSFLLLLMITILSSFKTTKGNERNLQIFPKDISDAQLDEIMDAYCVSLNVQCNYCHTEGNMADDTKDEKKIARKMMTMTNEINEKYFGKNSGTVSCMTCHNGKVHP